MSRKVLKVLMLLAAFALAGSAVAADEPTLHQVYQAADAGKFSEAQAMMDTVLRNHPNSAKAHFVEAELLAKQGRLSAAGAELKTAQRLEPGLPFANAQSVQNLERRISGGSGATRGNAAYPAAQTQSSGNYTGALIVMGLLLVGAFYFFLRGMRRRAMQTMPPSSGPMYAPGSPMPGQPYGGPMGTGQASSGMGSGILGGLATGAALGAGMVAGESLMHRLTDRNRSPVADDSLTGNQSNNSFMPDQSDWNALSDNDNMGGNDFGVSDGGSWDDSSSGGDWS